MTYENCKLSSYIRCKLNMTLKDYSGFVSAPPSTLQSRWRSKKGKAEIENAVFRLYVMRFDEL